MGLKRADFLGRTVFEDGDEMQKAPEASGVAIDPEAFEEHSPLAVAGFQQCYPVEKANSNNPDVDWWCKDPRHLCPNLALIDPIHFGS